MIARSDDMLSIDSVSGFMYVAPLAMVCCHDWSASNIFNASKSIVTSGSRTRCEVLVEQVVTSRILLYMRKLQKIQTGSLPKIRNKCLYFTLIKREILCAV